MVKAMNLRVLFIMKYKDIQKFTRDGDYECNVGLKHMIELLSEWVTDYGLELNPDFQRGNVWTEKQQISYIEFMLRGGKTSRVIYFNYPHWGDCYNDTNILNMHMVCVDGLQRLTAIKRFLDNEIAAFGTLINDFEDKELLLRKEMGIRFNVNNLKTKKEVLQWYLDFNTGGTVHSDEEINKVRNMLMELDVKN